MNKHKFTSAEDYLNHEYRGEFANTKEGLTTFIKGWNACADNSATPDMYRLLEDINAELSSAALPQALTDRITALLTLTN